MDTDPEIVATRLGHDDDGTPMIITSYFYWKNDTRVTGEYRDRLCLYLSPRAILQAIRDELREKGEIA